MAQGIAGKPFDRALEYNVGALAQLITVSNGKAQFTCRCRRSEILRATTPTPCTTRCSGPRGEYLSGDASLPRRPKTKIAQSRRHPPAR